MAAAVSFPLRPVPVEKSRDQPRFDFALLLRIEAVLIACLVELARPALSRSPAAARKDIAGYDDVFTVGRDHFAIGFGRETRDLGRAGAIGIHAPHLRRI